MMKRYEKLARKRISLILPSFRPRPIISFRKRKCAPPGAGKIRYILVDEYQDTNYIQERLVQILGGRERNIFVVGDDDQSIYRFRGATVANILQFQKHFGSSCRVITLHTNYRSGQGIVSFCMRWMAKPDWFSWERMGRLYRYRKGLLESGGGRESVPSVVRITAEEDDRLFEDRVCHFIEELKRKGCISDYNQVALLFDSVKGIRPCAFSMPWAKGILPCMLPGRDTFLNGRKWLGSLAVCFIYFPGSGGN